MAAKKKQKKAKKAKQPRPRDATGGAPATGGMCTSIRKLAERLGRSQKTVQAWLRRADFPARRSAPWTADEVAVINEWKDGLRPPRQAGQQVDPLLDGPSSPALERYRLARAQEAELNLEERRKNLVRVDVIAPAFEGAAAVFRRFAEIMRQRYGQGAADLMGEAVDEWANAVEKLFASFGRDPDTAPAEWGQQCAEHFAGYQPPARAADATPEKGGTAAAEEPAPAPEGDGADGQGDQAAS